MIDVQVNSSSRFRIFMIVIAACVTVYAVGMMSTAMFDAMVRIRNDLNMSNTGLQWITNAYLLFSCSFMIVMGCVAERVGRRNILVFGVLIFIIGALVAAFSGSGVWIIIARAIQGFGAAIVTPTTLAILKLKFPPQKQAFAVSLWSVFAGLGFGTGPVIGGSITDGISWRGIFWLNIILLVLGLVCLFLARAKNVKKAGGSSIDWWGALLLLLFLIPLVLAAVQGNSWGWSYPLTWGMFIWSAVVFCILLFVELRVTDPLVMFRFFKIPSFSLGAFGIGLTVFNIVILLFFMSLYMQTPFLLNYSATIAGVALLAFSVAYFIASFSSIRLANHLGYRVTLVVFSALQAGGFLWLCFIGVKTSYSFLWGPYVLIGLGIGFCMGVFPSIAMMAVPDENAGKAAGLVSTVNYFGGTLGPIVGFIFFLPIAMSCLASALHGVAMSAMEKQAIGNALAGHPTALLKFFKTMSVASQATVTSAIQHSAVSAYVSIMIIGAVVGVVLVLLSLLLAPGEQKITAAH